MIKQNYIRKVEPYLKHLKLGQPFYISLRGAEKYGLKLKRAGFPSLEEDWEILPSIVGNVTQINAEGKYRIRKDLPKEIVYYPKLWSWEEWAGRGNTVERSKIVDIPYERYKRERIPPAEEKIRLLGKGKTHYVISRELKKGTTSSNEIVHLVNLFLELFGECEILNKDLLPPLGIAVKRLNWEILPPGKNPWKTAKDKIEKVIKDKPDIQQKVFRSRFDTIFSFEPEFVASGIGGFRGYLVFAFPNKGLFVFENMKYGNATYIFEGDWENLSKLSKAEIISGNLSKARIVHRIKTWKHKIYRSLAA